MGNQYSARHPARILDDWREAIVRQSRCEPGAQSWQRERRLAENLRQEYQRAVDARQRMAHELAKSPLAVLAGQDQVAGSPGAAVTDRP